ncbi:MAG: hypothetical protein ACJ75Q_00220 [Gaiellaceae bacterium]
MAALALTACWTTAPLAAAGDPARPAPQQLWRSYPLDSARISDARRGAPPSRARPDSQPLASSGSPETTLWLLVAATLAAGLATAAVILARRRPALGYQLPAWRTPVSSPELKRAWFGLVDGARSLGATLREEVGSIAGPSVEFATPVGPESSGGLPEGEPRAQRASVKRLKEKRRSADQEEVELLKAKLTATPRRASITALRPRPTPIRTVAPAVERCWVEWWRGYVKSEFYAQEQRPDGGWSIVTASPPFRWSKPSPPPQTLPHVARAHAALVARLEANGWEVVGRGEHWYALELQRRPDQGPGAEREP